MPRLSAPAERRAAPTSEPGSEREPGAVGGGGGASPAPAAGPAEPPGDRGGTLRRLRSTFYGKLSLSHALIALLATAVVGLLHLWQLSNELRADLRRNLENTCVLLAPYVREHLVRGEAGAAQEELFRAGRESGVRLTLIRRGGEVLADTHLDARLMENHGRRREVSDAYEQAFGYEERTSATIGARLSYVAKVVEADGAPVGVVRAAAPLADVEAVLERSARTLALGAGAGALLAILGGLFAARRIARPIGEMTRAAVAVSRGDYAARVRDLPDDEIGFLGRALNDLAAALTRRLRESSVEQARLRAVLAGMIEGVVAVDEQDRVLFSNRAAREFLTGAPDQPLAGRLWEHVRVPGLGDLLREAQDSGDLVRRELSVLRDAGETLLDAHAARFRGGDASGVVLVLHDVTELRRLERVRRDFVANVSHELKTPLTAIQGFVETLLSGALRDEANNERFLRKIDHHVQRLVYLVSDLLSLARVESQEGKLALVPVDLGSVVAEVVREHESDSQARSVALRFDRPGEPLIVRGDRDGLLQVVGNLVDNAIKYTPRGGRVDLVLGHGRERGWLEVRDTGIGIPPSDVSRIFERFYRVDKARSREMGGTGLGLSIVKHLVGVMGGSVTVQSQPGRGSTFRVELGRDGDDPTIS